MSYYHLPTPGRRPIAWGAIGLLVVLSVSASLAAGWSAARPLTVSVDGRPVRLMSGTTVGSLSEQGLYSAAAGDLIGVNGSVVATAGGEPVRIERNGEYAAEWDRLYDGDVLVSARGSNRTEALITTDVPIPFETTFEGDGPIVELKKLGSPGVRRATVGERSGIEVTSTVITSPQDAVFVRVGPKAGDKLVALTFDDGPRRGSTDRILNILKQQEVPATFFVVGNRVKAQPALARRIVREGHQLGNHSYSHPDLRTLDRKSIRREVLQTRNAIRDATGTRTGWLRPPYGGMDTEAWGEMNRLDQHVVMWDVDPRDWSRPGTKKIVDNVLANVKPGSVVLLHDGGNDRRQTAAALPVIISRLKAQGYTFVTIQDLAGE